MDLGDNLWFCKGINNGCGSKTSLWGTNPFTDSGNHCAEARYCSLNNDGAVIERYDIQTYDNYPGGT